MGTSAKGRTVMESALSRMHVAHRLSPLGYAFPLQPVSLFVCVFLDGLLGRL